MKNVCLLVCLLLFQTVVKAQYFSEKAFKKGTLLVSISGGSTNANYGTKELGSGITYRNVNMDGIRDPLFFEYGISNKFGIGFSSGTDFFDINTKEFYNIQGETKIEPTIEAATSETTFDFNYHALVTPRLDVSLYTSFGAFGLKLQGKEQKYEAKGAILRGGINARYYIWNRFGILGMASIYSANASPEKVKNNTFGQNYSTSINGYALEFGFCFRIRK